MIARLLALEMPEVLCLLIYFPPQLNATILVRHVGPFTGLGICTVRMNSASSMVVKNGVVRKKTFYMKRKEAQRNLKKLPKVTQETSNRGMEQRQVF